MRKLFSLMLVVLGAAALVSCSKDDDDDVLREGEGVITFVTKAKSFTSENDCLYLETFNEGEKITVDWGDGWGEEEYVSVKNEYKDEDGEIEVYYEINAQHTYTDGKSSHTVTVRGKIEYFSVSHCKVTSIDATKCPALEELRCGGNQLTSLDVSGCTALKVLDCFDNKLASLDVSGCTALKELHCYDNQLTSLDVSECTALKELWCYQNQLTSLDVSKNTALEWLNCYDNQLTSLNVSGCTALEYLNCWNNQLTSLDASGCTALELLYCGDNQFSASAMNKIYNDLPVVEYGYLSCDKLGDYSIAERKGWEIN